ncbi:MAG: Cob(I)alamin adenosyltransferase [Candidatus Collierbacteria bacterium GW2011_GWC1_45_47]|uniref:Cob(I)alamin adenosyltransferase n=3 Tax=Candidatus Collieribacteriota TaxID=1752725 RepID=A0A0G1HKI6_9BACT|nr:MAG: Cob(I)alamin adenosyltransferase [Candidatus Collierbacteria bacterium GW2011_GWA1_44_12]KKT39534.1 MAG: Cob(I)alamin adenosyltransferase [Candidatus Collierbacteria bacterium GW2011_GWF1_44_12]KKT47088.1 MAG: Cob(I)alamin adenosyltransferase [Candidatus Collierbacteria bacterium GW2011_GWF2_44_15]KKU09807.1 MAG: Cob(I)alamin adenosyltransferase [Candidatus Collierbacteria bacterium GW2011_GWC1_45_47]
MRTHRSCILSVTIYCHSLRLSDRMALVYDKKMGKGMVYLFTGEGKGKTSAALGVMLRMLLIGKPVVWISWFKNREWQISEMGLDQAFPDLLEMYWTGEGFFIKEPETIINGVKMAKVNKGRVRDVASPVSHNQSAKKSLELVKDVLKRNVKPALVVMDEALQAIKEGLLTEKEVLAVIKQRGETHIVLTGRGARVGLIKSADLVTEMKKVKHPYDSGKLAIKGLDY